jgi:two-component system, chemotaxis family, chemotaxis protein CheY
MSKEDVIDTLKLSPRELESIVNELNRNNAQAAARSKRQLKRWTLQQQKVILTFVHGTASKVHGVAMPRNISRKGAAVLYGTFVHPGSKCFLSLRCVDGSTRSIAGVVMHCRHIKGRLHDLGIRFENAVNPRDFFIVMGSDYLFDRENVDIRGVTGKVLIADASLAMQRLLAHDLRGGDLTLMFARDAAQAIDQLTEEPDLLLVDYALPDMTGIDLVKHVREQGYTTPIVLITAEKDTELRLAAIGVGASEMLFKPISTELLHRAVAEYLSPTDHMFDPSTAGDASSNKMSEDDIITFVEELAKSAKQIDEALEKNDTDTVRSRVLELTATAAQFGFPAVGDQAAEVLRLIELTGNLQRGATEIRRLVRICERTKAPGG